MLSDRSYMRDDEPRGRTSVLVWILCAIAAGFVLQALVSLVFSRPGQVEYLAQLTVPHLRGGHAGSQLAFWAVHLFTYGFVHDLGNLLHVLFIGVAVYFLGRDLIPVLGSKGFVTLYFSTLVGGGLLWTAVHWEHGGYLLGAASAVAGLLAVFALLFPNQDITLFILFIPVTVKPKYVALTVLAIDLFACLFYELTGNLPPFGLAPSAHLGGMAAGWLYWRYVHEGSWRRASGRAAIELPKWIKRSPPGSTAPAAYQVNLGNREHLRAEVDRILDKINSQGFGALTADEKRLLDEAKDLLSRR